MIEPTEYAYETLEYLNKTRKMQECGMTFGKFEGNPYHIIDDDLMVNVNIYDVCNRKYAGFNKALWMMREGTSSPFYKDGMPFAYEHQVVDRFKSDERDLEFWCYIYILHRITGSGINYNQNPSGYANSPLLHLLQCNNILECEEIIYELYLKGIPIFTSGGYQIQPFKKSENKYMKAGEYYIKKILPSIANHLSEWLSQGEKKNLLDIVDYLNNLNKLTKTKNFHFAYAAVAADIADFHEDLVNTHSDFIAGSNAFECLGYMFKKKKPMNKLKFVNAGLQWLSDQDGNNLRLYDIEDCGACDVIRWLENYIPTGKNSAYSHLDLDQVFSNPKYVKDHPFGRQRYMLKYDIESFNHYSNFKYDKMLKVAGYSPEEYRKRVKEEQAKS